MVTVNITKNLNPNRKKQRTARKKIASRLQPRETRPIVPYWRVCLRFHLSRAKVKFDSVNINNDKIPHDMCDDEDFGGSHQSY